MLKVRTLEKGQTYPNYLQTTHGIWAFAAGGIGGVGLGQSKLKWSWIPEAENDFIFAIIGEELGFVGAVGLLCLFGLFAYTVVGRPPTDVGTLETIKTVFIAACTYWIGSSRGSAAKDERR